MMERGSDLILGPKDYMTSFANGLGGEYDDGEPFELAGYSSAHMRSVSIRCNGGW